MTNLQKIQKIQEAIEQHIRPALQRDNGDIELIDVNGNEVLVRLKKACANCPASSLTLRDFIQKELQEHVLPTLIIKEQKE